MTAETLSSMKRRYAQAATGSSSYALLLLLLCSGIIPSSFTSAPHPKSKHLCLQNLSTCLRHIMWQVMATHLRPSLSSSPIRISFLHFFLFTGYTHFKDTSCDF